MPIMPIFSSLVVAAIGSLLRFGSACRTSFDTLTASGLELVGRWTLVRQHDLAPLARRLHDRIDQLERRHAPASVVQDLPALAQRAVHLHQLAVAALPLSDERHLPLAVFVVDQQSVGRLADVPALA